jgi:hypothetical protein
MPTTPKRVFLGKGKGYLNVAGPQYRFIIFFLIVLVFYTLLLLVFQKLSVFLPLFVFLPISLITLLLFIGIVGTMYSHTIVGPLLRIRGTLERLAEGETNISLRLRESDDPLLKEIVSVIAGLAEHSRHCNAVVRESAGDLFKDVETLREKVRSGADKTEVHKQLEGMRQKQALLEKAIKSLGKT